MLDSLIKTSDGKTYVRVINTTSDPISFDVTTVEVQEIANLSDNPRDGKLQRVYPIQNHRSHREREKGIKETINLEHLNEEERDHVEK